MIQEEVDLESRLVMNEELSDQMKDDITCGICLQVITEDKNPQQCTSCENKLFCDPCIKQWSVKNKKCPGCNHENARY
jgi:Ring finger domain